MYVFTFSYRLEEQLPETKRLGTSILRNMLKVRTTVICDAGRMTPIFSRDICTYCKRPRHCEKALVRDFTDIFDQMEMLSTREKVQDVPHKVREEEEAP